jgi:hypothetical protein
MSRIEKNNTPIASMSQLNYIVALLSLPRT